MTVSFTDDQLELDVRHLIFQHRGKQNRIGRWDMVEKLCGHDARLPEDDSNIADRRIRGAVEALRKQGLLICDMGDGSGRYLAESMDEYQEFRNKYGSRAFTIIKTVNQMDKSAEEEFHTSALQPSLF